MTALPETIRPPSTSVDPVGWVKKNLLSTWYNALLTVFLIGFLYILLVGYPLLTGVFTWVIYKADWSPITSNQKLLLVGQYPSEELWRVGLAALIIPLFLGLSWGVWGGVGRTFALVVAIGFSAAALLPFSLEVRLWLLAVPLVVAGGYFLARTPVGRPRWVLLGGVVSFFLALVVLRGFGDNPVLPLVEITQFGGLLLTFLLALVGIVASFPLGVLLALGRRSGLPVLSLFSTLFIELIRGVPLVTLLFMTQVIVPLFLPEGTSLDRVLRALVAITLFSSAYMAENVRGGLQAVPQGQIEAARALGLSGPYVMLFIVLPQALRAVIPAIVGQFISLFKDTTLVATVGVLDILNIGKAIILGNVEFLDNTREVYVFLAAVFWIFTYSMSYASRKLEAALGVGKR